MPQHDDAECRKRRKYLVLVDTAVYDWSSHSVSTYVNHNPTFTVRY